MSKTKTLADKLKAAPAVSDRTGKSLVLTDGTGGFAKAATSLFAIRSEYPARAGNILRIRHIESALVSVRGSNHDRCAFFWISSYGEGTDIRTSVSKFFNHSGYSWFINGPSEHECSLYGVFNAGAGIDLVSVISLSGHTPEIIQVGNLPSDVTSI